MCPQLATPATREPSRQGVCGVCMRYAHTRQITPDARALAANPSPAPSPGGYGAERRQPTPPAPATAAPNSDGVGPRPHEPHVDRPRAGGGVAEGEPLPRIDAAPPPGLGIVHPPHPP